MVKIIKNIAKKRGGIFSAGRIQNRSLSVEKIKTGSLDTSGF